jgi:hypothetical protein
MVAIFMCNGSDPNRAAIPLSANSADNLTSADAMTHPITNQRKLSACRTAGLVIALPAHSIRHAGGLHDKYLIYLKYL